MHAISRTYRRISAFPLFLAVCTFAQNPPESALRPDKRFQKRVVASKLAHPWEVTWGPDDLLWITERTGKRVVRIDPQTGERRVAITLPDVSSPGGQDGLLGLALHPELLRNTGHDFVYVAYTTEDRRQGPDPSVTDLRSRYRFLYMRVVRLTYNPTTQTLSSPVPVLTGLPAGDDHNAGRLKFGPDNKLYLTLGDQGHNQFGNYCLEIGSQRLPTQSEIANKDYSAYVGKTLRINLDGSIPEDNPRLAGLVSHVYTYGHRNTQGIAFAPDGTLYGSEHGPKTDDEVNVLKAGANYGWPNVAGFKDDKAYVYAKWAGAGKACKTLHYDDISLPSAVPQQPESAFTETFVEPIATLFTVPTGFNFKSPACKGFEFLCWPTVGIGSLEHYESKAGGIPGWDRVLLVTALKRGSLYVVPLQPDGQSADGRIYRYFRSENRYRDVAVNPGRNTIYLATDPEGMAESLSGGATTVMEDPGSILAFTYQGEGAEADEPASTAPEVSAAANPVTRPAQGPPPQFTAAQAAAGKTAYQSRCAVCHGSTLTNGAYGTPLAGEYFHRKWSGQPVRALFEKSRKMPPSSPASLSNDAYANIVAYILSTNGSKAGDARLPAAPAALGRMTIQ